MEAYVFYLFAFIIIASGIAVVTMRNIFHCALMLIFCLFTVAGLYVLLSAEFLAVVQVLLYVGAVAILMIFAIMLTSRLAGREVQLSNEQTFVGGFLALVFALGIFYAVNATYFVPSDAVLGRENSLAIGKLLMTEFVLPFEVISVLLLAALIGAIIIARREGN
ncbi:MAG: NADH-quinone oxidoreductase subunit J [candidate division Zixibacteria bacterium]|nr:NADH-quinone oxidoreductase subunit J [candidate division Zixibacteria bacterium]